MNEGIIDLNGETYLLEEDEDGMFRGALHGEDFETETPWTMAFWVPRAAVDDIYDYEGEEEPA